MSHTLTEVDEFTPTVVVPDGLDPGSERSENVAAIAQALANRTTYLRTRVDPLTDAAHKNAPNTFTQPNSFQAISATEINAAKVNAAEEMFTPWLRATDITASNDIDCGRNFGYLPVPTHSMQLWPEGGPNVLTQDRVTLNPGQLARFRVRCPSGAKLLDVFIKIEQIVNGGASYTLRTYHQAVKSFSDTTSPGVVSTMKQELRPTTPPAGVHNYNLGFGNLIVDNAANNYWLYVGNDSGSGNAIDVWAAQIVFQDPGPRNH